MQPIKIHNKILKWKWYKEPLTKSVFFHLLITACQDKCFQNFTDDLILLYLIDKPSCTKFIASWLASPNHLQDEYIDSLKKTKPNYIIYSSVYFKVDGVEMSDRLKKVNDYILKNYQFYKNINSYGILKIKD